MVTHYYIFPISPIGPARRVYGELAVAVQTAQDLAVKIGRQIAVAEPVKGWGGPHIIEVVKPPLRR